jgi:GntR family transcriptional repressor for pyruvate dehydrogenase complex
MPTLKPVSRVTLGEQVAAQLADQITEGRWRPGDKLPSESELCATLHIGRSTLREALKSLAFIGLVQMRPGEGTYVLDGTQLLVDRIRTRGLLKSEKDLQDVGEARMILETELAALAAERADESDLDKLQAILDEMKESLRGTGRDYAALDVEFHLAIAKSSQNRLLHELLVPIRGVLQEFITKSQELPGIKQSAQNHHTKILAALRQRDPEKARRAMRAHLSTCEKAFTLLGKIGETALSGNGRAR